MYVINVPLCTTTNKYMIQITTVMVPYIYAAILILKNRDS